MIACRRFSMDVTGVGGKKSFIITSYLLILWFKAAFHSTYGLQLITIHACAATAIHSGSHVRGDVGDALWLWITCCFTFNELNDFVQNESIEPAWPIHQGNLLCMDQSRWILKMTSLTRTHVYITHSFCKGKGGQPVYCMITLLVILLTMPIMFDAWSWVDILTTIAILMIHWWCDQLRQLVLMIASSTEATPPRRGV